MLQLKKKNWPGRNNSALKKITTTRKEIEKLMETFLVASPKLGVVI